MTNKHADDDRDDAHPLRRAVTNSNFESVVDKLVGQAREQGQFDNLQGQGKPLRDDAEEALVPEELRAGYRMLKNAGFAPPWVEARRSLDEQRNELDRWLAQANVRWRHIDDAGRAKMRTEHQRRLQELQREIMNYNLTTPQSAGQVPGLQIALELAKLGST